MTKEELINLKEIYLNLLENTDIIINKLDSIKINTEIVNNNINNYFMINEISGDNGFINNSLDVVNNQIIFLKDNVKEEIFEVLNNINQQINS